jgi:hypothetical protein
MDSAHLADLLRSLARTPSRRGVARALAGFTLAGALTPLLGLPEADAKRRKKNKRRRKKKKHKQKPQPFCAGKDVCAYDLHGAACNTTSTCQCFITAEADEPFCALPGRNVTSCAECAAEETCVDVSGPACGAQVGCVTPCPDPF